MTEEQFLMRNVILSPEQEAEVKAHMESKGVPYTHGACKARYVSIRHVLRGKEHDAR